MADNNNKSTWTIVILVIALGLSVWFGIQQYKLAAEARGNVVALNDTVRYWKDAHGHEIATRSILIASQMQLQHDIDSLNALIGYQGAQIVSLVKVAQQYKSTLKPVPDHSAWWSDTIIWMDSLGTNIAEPGTTFEKHDTAIYQLTAEDTLAWFKNGWYKTYATQWDTAKVWWDSVQIKTTDSLVAIERQQSEGGLFNHKIVPYIDVYHTNPGFSTTDIKAWRVYVPKKRWFIGPAINAYPRYDNGVKLGFSFGLSAGYTLISF